MPHKTVSLALAVLLLMQYAPRALLVAGSEHASECPHCTRTYCLRDAQGRDHAAETAVHEGSPHAASHADTGPRFCTCTHQGSPTAFALTLDKVILGHQPGARPYVRLNGHRDTEERLPPHAFLSGLFHPPRLHV